MPKLVFHDSDGVDKTVPLGTEPVVIGRASDCQIQTHDAMVSRKHARITWDGSYWIEDLGSANGVFLGTEKVQRAPFRPGDVVTCGSLVVRMMPEVRRQTETPEVPRQRVPTPVAEPPKRRPTEAEREWAEQKHTSSNPPLAAAAGDQAAKTDLRKEVARREEAERALLKAEAQIAASESNVHEIAQLRRRVEQLQADLRRARDEAVAPAPAIDLGAAEEAVAVFNDALAGLKANLRSAVDEAELLTAPPASVRVVRESMRSAMDELERARDQLREMTRQLGLKNA